MSGTALETTLLRWKMTFVFSSALGGITGLVGTVIGTLSLLRLLSDYHRVENFGTVLLVVAFPLLILAAHSIDKAHEAEKSMTMVRTGWNM
ncbi:MAG: hypothetical protein IPL32_13505 [Chloracidobacterium sp.]|nr:hypothetical protein [Chloracidobacterium sp.]